MGRYIIRKVVGTDAAELTTGARSLMRGLMQKRSSVDLLTGEFQEQNNPL
jgi:hypothetical protein